MSEQPTKIIDEHTGQQDRIWSMLRLAWEEIIYLKSQLAASSSEFVPGVLSQRLTADMNVIRPGGQGFGVGVCPGPLPDGMKGIDGYNNSSSDTYGNYIYTDGSVMVWVPAFFYAIDVDMNVDIQPLAHFPSVATANAAGYALHRAFYDGGAVQPGVFVDKFLCSNNNGVASSLKNGNPLSTYSEHNPINALNGRPANAYYGTIEAAKTRGSDFFVNTRFIFSALALLSLAHAQASVSTAHCGWYHPAHSFPKGCNSGLGDVNDSEISYESDGYSSCGKTGSANHLNRTTHNGQNSGVCDLNGCMWEITPGITSDGKRLYILKTSARMKDVTGGATTETDLWGPKGIKANYETLNTEVDFKLPNGYSRLGSDLNTLSADQDGTGWQLTGLGIALPGENKNALLSGSFWNYPDNRMCPISGGHWDDGSNAGVWAFYLGNVRGYSTDYVGFRSALYL
jgi:hypothetical protein